MKSAFESALVFIEDERTRLYVLLDLIETSPSRHYAMAKEVLDRLHHLECGSSRSSQHNRHYDPSPTTQEDKP
jgi:hypothetical protein